MCKELLTKKAHLEPFQTSMMECFAKAIKVLKPLTNFPQKNSVIDVWKNSKYDSGIFIDF